MGLFNNDTEEEKKYKKLIKAIRYSDLKEADRNFLIDYVDKINSGQINNDFYEFEFLNRIVLELLSTDHYQGIEKTINEYKNILSLLLPEGVYTEDSQGIMEMFINNFCGESGIIEKNLFNRKFYALFQNRYDYIFIMNMIIQDNDLRYKAHRIFDYAIEVSPYCSNAQVFKNELLSFMNDSGFVVGDDNEYIEKKLNEAKKRCGVYAIDEKTLANISAEAERAQALIAKLDSLRKNISTYQERVKALTASGKKEITTALNQGKREIKEYSESAVTEMSELIANTKTEIIEELDRYLLTLEETMKKNSDQVFSSVLLDAQKKIREIKIAAQGLSSSTTSELLRIQSATEESVGKLKSYVENEPQLKELLKGAEADESIREALLKFNSLQTGATTQSFVVGASAPGIIIPGYDRIVTPANPSVVVPEGGTKSIIIPAFDESIPFDTRMNRILEEKNRREQQGEIFHDMTEEIIRCLLEGDWCYLWGPSGCGKSYTIKQIARLAGIDMVDNGKITDKYSIMAYNDPQGRFRATQAFVALVYGKLLSLDEFDNGNPDTQVVLNELYSGLLDVLEKPDRPRYVTFAEDMTVPIHPNFRMISAGNTSGEGENQAFSSRGKIDESVQQRMTPKRFWYDNRVEKRIFGDYENWYNVFVNFRKVCDAYAERDGLDTPVGIVTTRDASAIVKYITHNSKSVDQVLAEKFVQTKNDDYLKFIMNKFQEIYNINRKPQETQDIKDLSGVREIDIAKKLILQCSKKKSERR